MATDHLVVSVKNHAMLHVETDMGIQRELSESFSFYAHNYKYMPAYKNKMWDGKIRLFNYNTKELNVGLFPRLEKWCEQRDYMMTLKETDYGLPFDKDEVTVEYLYEFLQKLGLPFEVRDYQFKAIYRAITDKRRTVVSPTGSGKSLIIYATIAYYLAHQNKHGKVLVVVPTTGLVEQMKGDFADYGLDAEKFCHTIYSGKDKNNIKAPIVISTWQSIHKLGSKWFDKFGMVIGDECHGFKAKCLSSIMNKAKKAPYRIGTTGTLDGTEVNQLVLEGLFGPVFQVTTTAELQKRETLAQLDIKMLNLKHDRSLLPSTSKVDYKKEMDVIVKNERRNKFIHNLATDLEGNTLVLFNFIEKQGDVLDALFKESTEDFYYVHGGTKVEDRDYVRSIVERKKNAIILASYGVFSTGINIKNIHNIIFATPYKSQIRILQSIGRGLRLSDNGQHTTLYDLVDKFGDKKGYAFKHGQAREEIYKKEGFNVNSYDIDLI